MPVTPAGFKHYACLVHVAVHEHLRASRRPKETKGQTLERLLLGDARDRPAPEPKPSRKGMTSEERQADRARRKQEWLAAEIERLTAPFAAHVRRRMNATPTPENPAPTEE